MDGGAAPDTGLLGTVEARPAAPAHPRRSQLPVRAGPPGARSAPDRPPRTRATSAGRSAALPRTGATAPAPPTRPEAAPHTRRLHCGSGGSTVTPPVRRPPLPPLPAGRPTAL